MADNEVQLGNVQLKDHDEGEVDDMPDLSWAGRINAFTDRIPVVPE